MPTIFTSCYPTISGKCNIEWKENCTTQGNQLTLKYDNSVHHVLIDNNGTMDTSQFVDQTQMQANYLFQAIQTSSNPIVWGTVTVQWVCGQPQLKEVFNGDGDLLPWHQGCSNSGSSGLPYDKVYIYYRGGREYQGTDIQDQYFGIMMWLQNNGWVDPAYQYTSLAGEVYHTIIGGGGNRWLDWATSAYTGALNNSGTGLGMGVPNIYNGDCDTNSWDEYNGPFAAGALGDTLLWSHNTAGIYDFYSSTAQNLTTSATSTGQQITSLGLPPVADNGDKVLVIILNDESTCTYHGSQSPQTATVNATTYQNVITFDSGCQVGGDIVNEGNVFVWKNDYAAHIATLSQHTGNGGTHNGVNWPTMPSGDMTQPKNYSYALHVTGCITNGNQGNNQGVFNSNSRKYHPTENTALWGPDGIPQWNLPPGGNLSSDGNPSMRYLETVNPYASSGAGNLELDGWTFPKFYGGTEWNNTTSPDTITQPGINPPNNSYIIPTFPIQLQETINLGFGVSTTTCNPPIDCITVQACDVSNANTCVPIAGYLIDFGTLGSQITDANGYAFFNNIAPGTYDLFGEQITTQGQCLEFLYQVQVGTCIINPSEQCACGCTDPTAINYDPNAACDDGSCRYDVLGCTDPTACNYNPLATIDDGSCTFPGCTDPAAPNYNATAGCDDGSCEEALPDCDIAYGQNDPGEHLTDVDVKRIETEALFADDVYKHFQAMRFGMTSPCANSIDRRAAEKYLCFWEDKKEKEYTGFAYEREVFKPLEPGVPPEAGTHPNWVDPLCGLTEKGELTVYFYYDGTSLGINSVKNIHAASELWIQTLKGKGFNGKHYHTVIQGERWLDWATSSVTGQLNNAGKGCTPLAQQSNNPACQAPSERACAGGCYAFSEFHTGGCGCHQQTNFGVGLAVQVADWAQNGDCATKWYDGAVPGTTCNLWATNPGIPGAYTPIGTSVSWSGPPPAASTEQVLVVVFADESDNRLSAVNNDPDFMCYHVRGSLNGTATDWNLATVQGDPSLNFRNDYDKYLEIYNDFTSRSCNHKLNCFLYPAKPDNENSTHRPFPLHALGAISSGNKPTPDGTFITGTAPVNGLVGGTNPMTAIELSNPYWSYPNPNNLVSGYGGLDRFGWGVNVAQVSFTAERFTSDLDDFFDLNLYQCDDNECLVFDVVNQNGDAIKDFEIYLDGKDVGKTNEFGRYTHIIPQASVNTDHTVQLCECFKTSGDCAQQRIKITATELCPDAVCTDPDPQCTCNAPGNLQVTNLTHETATLNWSASTTTETSVRYDVRYRVVNTTTPNTWIEVNDITNTYYALTGLGTQIKYEFQVRAECLDADGIIKKTSDWNALQQFTTTGLCPEVKALLSLCNSATTYVLGWILTETNSLSTAAVGGSTGKWGVVWGTSSSISYVSGATPTGGGVIETTMVPGTANTYPGGGVADTIITQTTTGSLVSGTTYYWRGFIDMAGCTLIQTEIKSFTVA